MTPPKDIILTRDCEAIQIPSGTPTSLPVGTAVCLTQALGGYTVSYDGGLARIQVKDADALGLEPEGVPSSADGTQKAVVDEQALWGQLKSVFDPEIPVNIVDLGLVYSLEIFPKEDGTHRVAVKMTLTAPGCGMGPVIAEDARHKMLSIHGVSEAEVELVWEPPWNQGMISEAGRMQLGWV